MSEQTQNLVIEVITNPDGISATGRNGKKYKIQSIMLGMAVTERLSRILKSFYQQVVSMELKYCLTEK